MNAFLRFLGLRPDANTEIVDRIYERIVAAARVPALYRDFGVPDTPLGRFEMIGLHLALLLRAARGQPAAVASLMQELTDEFFKDVDHSLRELGIGDVSVPKRMKKLAKMFYGRLDAYGRALDAGDRASLADALARNIAPEGGLEDAGGLADYALETALALEAAMPDAVLAGDVTFPQPGRGEQAS